MQGSWPEYYHTLRPFRELFGTGVPILMYHKIAPRPRKVRLKGLYVAPDHFAKQLAELRESSFVSCTPTEALKDGNGSPRIVLTFDDGFRNVFQNAMRPLAEGNFRALQFLVPNFIGKLNEWDLREGEAPELLMDAAEVRDWLAAGHTIGSHSLTHARLTRLTVRDAREEIFTSKKKLEDTFNVPVEHFCYPYGDWNEGVRDLVMEAGYRTACTTQFGVNTPATPALTLHRIAVRHPTRNLRALKEKLLAQLVEAPQPQTSPG